MLQRGFGDHPERVGLLLAVQRWVAFGGIDLRRGEESVPRRGERLDQHSADFRRQQAADDHHAVGVLIDLQGSVAAPGHDVGLLGGPIDIAPAADEPLDVLRGAGLAERQQSLFGFRGLPHA